MFTDNYRHNSPGIYSDTHDFALTPSTGKYFIEGIGIFNSVSAGIIIPSQFLRIKEALPVIIMPAGCSHEYFWPVHDFFRWEGDCFLFLRRALFVHAVIQCG